MRLFKYVMLLVFAGWAAPASADGCADNKPRWFGERDSCLNCATDCCKQAACVQSPPIIVNKEQGT
jgi:hypothetical protein